LDDADSINESEALSPILNSKQVDGGVDEVVYRYYYGRKTKIEGGAFEF
jgi:hypothetical protein